MVQEVLQLRDIQPAALCDGQRRLFKGIARHDTLRDGINRCQQNARLAGFIFFPEQKLRERSHTGGDNLVMRGNAVIRQAVPCGQCYKIDIGREKADQILQHRDTRIIERDMDQGAVLRHQITRFLGKHARILPFGHSEKRLHRRFRCLFLRCLHGQGYSPSKARMPKKNQIPTTPKTSFLIKLISFA